MQNRHLDSEHVRFKPQEGERNPGFKPKHFKILVLPDLPEDKTESGIALPDEVLDQADWAQTEGELIAVGDRAFEDWSEPVEVGERVIFARHAGQKITGVDGKEYRAMHDNDVLGVRE